MTYTPITHGQSNWDVPVNAAFTDQDARITTNANAIVTTAANLAKSQTGRPDAADSGFQAWSADPVLATGTSAALVSGSLYLNQVKVTNTFVTTSIWYVVHAGGSGLTSGQNFIALFDAAGNRVAISADLTTDWATPATKNTPWVSSASLAPGMYYAAILSNGTTPINVVKTATFTNTGAFTANLSSANLRSSTGGTGLTSLTAVPSTVTMSNRSAGSNTFWCALV